MTHWYFDGPEDIFETDCLCGVWCRGLTIILQYVSPLFENPILSNSWFVIWT